MPKPTNNNYVILYKARTSLNIIKKFKGCYVPSCDSAVDDVMIGFICNSTCPENHHSGDKALGS
jgi:hypothetical protein